MAARLDRSRRPRSSRIEPLGSRPPEYFCSGRYSFSNGKKRQTAAGSGAGGEAARSIRRAGLLLSRAQRQLDPPPFRYRDFGSLATIGRNFAIMERGKFKISGFFAWVLWGAAHIYFFDRVSQPTYGNAELAVELHHFPARHAPCRAMQGMVLIASISTLSRRSAVGHGHRPCWRFLFEGSDEQSRPLAMPHVKIGQPLDSADLLRRNIFRPVGAPHSKILTKVRRCAPNAN